MNRPTSTDDIAQFCSHNSVHMANIIWNFTLQSKPPENAK